MALSGWRQTLLGMRDETRPPVTELIGQIDEVEADDDAKIELPGYVALLEYIGRRSRPSSIAWITGQAVDLPFGKAFSNAIRGCQSLGTALSWLCQYFPLLQDASLMRLDVSDETTTLSYKILDPEIWPRHEDAMFTLGICAKLIKAAAPDAWTRVQVAVEAEPEQVNADLRRIVQANVVYGSSTNAIRMPTSILNSPLKLDAPCSPEVFRDLTAALTRKRRAMPICERTRLVIYRQMNDGCVNQDQVARELGVSRRTLRRRLSIDGQSFQKLLDECRMQCAAFEFRTHSTLSLSDMALQLGYSEHSTFSRAFARWAGMAPQEYRRLVATS